MKKTISFILAVIMVFGVFSVSASAQGNGTKYSGIYSVSPTELDSAATDLDNTKLTKEDFVTAKKLYGAATIRALYDDIHNTLKNRESSIDISKYNIPADADGSKAIYAIVQAVLDNTYDLLLESAPYRYSYIDTILQLSFFDYGDESAELYKKHYAEAMQNVENIVSDMPSNLTELEQVLYVYNYLALNFEYDVDLYNEDLADNVVRDIYRFFKEKKGVCQAYTKAFSAIMDRLGIECYEVMDRKYKHTWNVVGINNMYYNVDTTWADPVSVTADKKMYDTTGNISYDWFLLSDETIIAKSANLSGNGGHSADSFIYDDLLFGKNIECTDKTYESGYVWNNTDTSLTYCNGKWYYICNYSYSGLGDADLNYTDSSLKNPTTDITFELGHWYFVNDDEYVLGDCSTSMFTYGDYICFNTSNNIVYYDIKTGIVDNLLTSFNDYNLFGCSYDGHGNLKTELREYSLEGKSVILNSVKRSDEKIYLADYCDTSKRAENLVKLKKYLITGEIDGNWAYYDVAGNIGLDIRDLIKLKRVYAQ